MLISSLIFLEEFLWKSPDLRYLEDFILVVDDGEGVLQYLFDESELRFFSISLTLLDIIVYLLNSLIFDSLLKFSQ